MELTVITAVFDGYDNLREPLVHNPAVRYICYTDHPWSSKVWEMHTPPDLDGLPARRARRCKILAEVDTPFVLWHDGQMQLKCDPLVLLPYIEGVNLVAWIHPWRDCLYREAQECINRGRGNWQEIEAQVARYRALGMPTQMPLIETGFLLRRNNVEQRAFNELWWAEIQQGSWRDQLSFPFVCWQTETGINLFPDKMRQNRWVILHGEHAKPAI